MPDVTSSAKFSFTGKTVQAGPPWVSELPIEQITSILKLLLTTGRYEGGAITIAAGVVTVPVGTVLCFVKGDQVFRVEVTTALTIPTNNNDHVYLQLGFPTSGKLSLFIGNGPTLPGDALDLGVSNGASTFTLNAGLDKSSVKKQYIRQVISLNGNLVTAVHVPCAGTITGLTVVEHGAVAVQATVKLQTNAAVDVPNATVTLSTSGSGLGTVVTASPAPAAAVNAKDILRINTAGNNTAVNAEVIVEITQ